MKEIVIISGKGGTGKTSIAASFAVLADSPVIADCDVDTSDMHLIFAPSIRERHNFYCGHKAVIREKDCLCCGTCLANCRFEAVETCKDASGNIIYKINPITCEGCGVCVRFCSEKAIDFPYRLSGEWMISDTRCAPMVHAKLVAAAENSGKLVSIVRREARRLAEKNKYSLIIVDGPPGIGCPVIASITGASQVVVITEPTVTGEHDMLRVLSLTKHFNIPAVVCINKWDINPGMSENIEKKAVELKATLGGRIRYDKSVTTAQMQEKAVVEIDAQSGDDIRQIWQRIG